MRSLSRGEEHAEDLWLPVIRHGEAHDRGLRGHALAQKRVLASLENRPFAARMNCLPSASDFKPLIIPESWPLPGVRYLATDLRQARRQ